MFKVESYLETQAISQVQTTAIQAQATAIQKGQLSSPTKELLGHSLGVNNAPDQEGIGRISSPFSPTRELLSRSLDANFASEIIGKEQKQLDDEIKTTLTNLEAPTSEFTFQSPTDLPSEGTFSLVHKLSIDPRDLVRTLTRTSMTQILIPAKGYKAGLPSLIVLVRKESSCQKNPLTFCVISMELLINLYVSH